MSLRRTFTWGLHVGGVRDKAPGFVPLSNSLWGVWHGSGPLPRERTVPAERSSGLSGSQDGGSYREAMKKKRGSVVRGEGKVNEWL